MKMETYTLRFVEYHTDIAWWQSMGYKLLDVANGIGTFEHVQDFLAADDGEARRGVFQLKEWWNNSTGIFEVYRGDTIVFTEEDI